MRNRITLSRKSFLFLITGCFIALGFVLNFVHQVAAKESGQGDPYRHLETFSEVLSLVEKNYVEPTDIKELVEGSIKGMLLTLDPHTGYLNEDFYRDLQVETKGEFGGLGIEITIKDGLLTVVTPIEDSPASRAGVRSGDKIIKIGDDFSKNFSLIEAVKKMRGPKGTPITISVKREGIDELIPITIVRDVIKVKSVRSRMLDDGYGYVRVAQFQEGTAAEFTKALLALKAKVKSEGKLKGLVLDVRNNPGGLLTQAIRVSDLFLKEGVIVYTEGRLETQKQKYYAHDDKNEPEFPMIVLINGGSASASEIVAGALQDHGRSLILGQQSFGKGSVQTILPMKHGDALRLTTALYYTKSGRSIQAEGITPDVAVSDKPYPSDSEELLEEDESPKEKDLPGALKNPSKDKAAGEKEEHLTIGSRSAMKADLSKLLKEDPQLAEALKLLKTLHIFQGKPTIEAQDHGPSAVPNA